MKRTRFRDMSSLGVGHVLYESKTTALLSLRAVGKAVSIMVGAVSVKLGTLGPDYLLAHKNTRRQANAKNMCAHKSKAFDRTGMGTPRFLRALSSLFDRSPNA